MVCNHSSSATAALSLPWLRRAIARYQAMARAHASPAGESLASVSRRSASVNKARFAAATPCATPAAPAKNLSGHFPALLTWSITSVQRSAAP
ncbi:Uncharacterised protein [Mycobacterium tuberculosis]|uniref:Uncharacterized protein n=1 Tax=Mycobacterium tuberculosis TaxID=1773 RepID=A0A654ZKQ3_MYCTX|nr:Uncharacterised protein [Mycobacterium tuberculosis]CKP93035.1 Uncharacterised protein [Mycobacterium tuberculosis]CKQ77207.1 Uncharacterised protein [Mycobacterium tuberculosis]CKU20318.1 Uncharacterised protein [Mycobacterium tuberculosis]CNM66805.1 Uncharacterised protein [Mycobacterium tuberculosis]